VKILAIQVLTAVRTKLAVFWVVAPCSLVEVSLKCQQTFTRLHGATTQKAAIFVFNGVTMAYRTPGHVP
jgi:hypothetical protein